MDTDVFVDDRDEVYFSADEDVVPASVLASPTSTPILDLPTELLQHILGLVYADDTDIDGMRMYLTKRLAMFKKNLLPVCRAFHDAGLHALYSHVHVGHPRAFDVFRYELSRRPQLGSMVKCLDFSDFTSVGLGRTRRMNREIQMVTSDTIADALHKTPNLREFLVSESVEDDIDKTVLDKLFSLPDLEAVDFCGATGAAFKSAFVATTFPSGTLSNLTRVSLHECAGVQQEVFERFMPKLTNLKRLDVTHTQVSAAALNSIPSSARLTHLSLAKCRNVQGKDVVQFLLTHPAVRSVDLRWLSLRSTNITESQLRTLLPGLPSGLLHLNLYFLPVEPSHLPLIPLQLQALSLGFADLSIDALIENFSAPLRPDLRYLDLTGNPHITIWTIQDLRLLGSCSDVRTWEFDAQILGKMADVRVPGYNVVLGQGRRGWIFKKGDMPPVRRGRRLSNGYNQHVLGMDMGQSDAWAGASRKIDCSGKQWGGGLERGIYLYYAYRTK
ncbi:hypothetical protein V1514DRAFT_294055 [Lipomyces japonicus]|uniref:uncharacterized protein n=1 Tax=Lipomyces japonicus TaxID=56871 RepID=UPI0034CDBBE7